MMYRLYDTSVWVDFRRGVFSVQTNQLDQDLIDGAVCICPVIIQEILQGIRDDKEFEQLKNDFTALKIIEIDPTVAAIEAANLYRELRKKGATIRKPNDCLIAIYALHFNAELCHNDSDFDFIAAHSALKIYS